MTVSPESDPAPSPDIDLEAHRRSHPRLRLGIEAQLETLDGRQTVRLIDVSQSGAHLILTRPGDIRNAVLTWLGFEAFGAIVWQKGDELGMAFDQLLPLRHLVETRQLAPTVVREEALGAQRAAQQWVAGTLNVGSER